MTDAETYTCAACHRTVTSTRSADDANREAERNFGISQASHRPDMARICDDCYRAMIAAGLFVEVKPS